MRDTFQFIFFMLALIALPKMSIAQDTWINFKSDNVIPFSVDAPGEMEETISKYKTAVGELNTVTYAYEGLEDDPNYLYLINFVQYPEETFPADSVDLIEEYLQNAALSSAEKVNGELVYATETDRYKGKLFRIRYNDGNAVAKCKSYIKNDVFINLQVFTIKNRSLNNEMDQFLDSFKFKVVDKK